MQPYYSQCAIPVPIAAGRSLSAAVNIGNGNKLRFTLIIPPTIWTPAGISFQSSSDGVGLTWNEVLIASGAPYALGPFTGALEQCLMLDPYLLSGTIRVRSGSLASPVAQVSAVTLQILAIPFYG